MSSPPRNHQGLRSKVHYHESSPLSKIHYHESRTKLRSTGQLLAQTSAGEDGTHQITLGKQFRPKFPLTVAILGTCIDLSLWLQGPHNLRIQVSSLLALSPLLLALPFGNPSMYILLPPFLQELGIWDGEMDLDLQAQGNARGQGSPGPPPTSAAQAWHAGGAGQTC